MNYTGPLNTQPLKILLVEDDDGDAKAVRRGFRRTSMVNVERAIDGQQALEMLRGTEGQTALAPPNVFIVDLNMPRMNGIQFVQAMRADAELKHSIVFILTTSKSQKDKLAAYDLNVAGYIDKATTGEEFLNLVNLVYYYWRTVDLP
jgi:CheY-like chemotaxis protein